jgi:hypothetical protein
MQDEMTIDELKMRLKNRSCRKIHEDTGIHWNTISNIRLGKNKNHSAAILSVLIHYVKEHNL